MNRATLLHSLSNEETRLLQEQDELAALVDRVGRLDSDIAHEILQCEVIRNAVIIPIREEVAVLGRSIQNDAMSQADREAKFLARQLLLRFLEKFEFRAVKREGYIKKLWKEVMAYARR